MRQHFRVLCCERPNWKHRGCKGCSLPCSLASPPPSPRLAQHAYFVLAHRAAASMGLYLARLWRSPWRKNARGCPRGASAPLILGGLCRFPLRRVRRRVKRSGCRGGLGCAQAGPRTSWPRRCCGVVELENSAAEKKSKSAPTLKRRQFVAAVDKMVAFGAGVASIEIPSAGRSRHGSGEGTAAISCS